MRDTFLLLWVGFLIIGVIGSIISTVRKQVQQQQAAGQPPRRIPAQWQPPQRRVTLSPATSLTPKTVTPPPRKPPVVSPPLHEPAFPSHAEYSSPRAESRGRPRLFRNRSAIVQAVIAAEVLGKPRALRDEYS